MKKVLFLLTAMIGTVLPSHAQLVINEIMQSNIDCIMDDLNEFPDSWVELYNSGDASVNLADYKIGSKKGVDKAWQLPGKTIPSHGFALIYCDKEESGLHTSFRLESDDKGKVFLFKGSDQVDLVEYAAMPAPNIAYGRLTEGSGEWGYQAIPTPGAANCGKLSEFIKGTPNFSVQGQVFTESNNIRLLLKLPEDAPSGAVIRYTTDGSEPTMQSTPFTSAFYINQSTVVRAKIFCDGYLSAPSTTQSYIFLNRKPTLPVVSIVTDDRYLNDPKIGIYVDGTYQSGTENYRFDWRRPINFEYFEAERKASSLNQLCETRIQGGATRTNKLKSLAVYANKRFGTKRFEYEFFPDQKPGLTKFKSIVLRNAGNDFDYLYMRDIIAQRTMASHADLDWQAWRPVIIFINGEYKGIENIRERSNEDNIYTNYDGLEDVDLVENWNDLKEGDMEHLNAFKAFFNEHDHTMAEYEKWVDCQEFINLMAMNIYYNNIDFPGNNIVLWRPRTDDGRWRFIAKDVDYTMWLYGQDNYDYKYLNWLYYKEYDYNHNWGANDYEATRLFRRLMEDADFNREFIDHMAVYMGDFLNYEGTWKVWEPMYNQIKTEYPIHRKLYNEWWPNYNEEMDKVKTWLQNRTNFMYQHLADYYQLEAPKTLVVNASLGEEDLQAIQFTFNGIPLSEGKFNGKFYQDRSVVLEGKSVGDKKVTGWEVKKDGVTTRVDGSQYAFTMPSSNAVVINAIVGIDTGIDNVATPAWTWQRAGSMLTVNNLTAGTRVSLYDAGGILINRQTADGTSLQFAAPAHRVYILKVGNETIMIR
ncbi:MAG: CotH kinase family protein [Prevotella sp.]|nr:CotH kinase family protein [Prevotella sp.]